MNTFESTLTLILLAAALIALLVALTKTIRADGYGHRPGPRSHYGFGGRPSDL